MNSSEHQSERAVNQGLEPRGTYLQRPEASADQQADPWRVELGDWGTAQSSAAPIRFEVFVREQLVPIEEEIDALDVLCTHAVAFDATGRALATGRLLPDGHIGRMAVLKVARTRGLGSAVLIALMQHAREKGFSEVVLSAQTHALGFYLRHGFVPEGAEYLDANIPHILMRKAL
jgi:predicted GNAT family N-acyltransferase